MYVDAGDAKSPRRFQWEANSGTFSNSQSNNCGPTVASLIAQFYRDTWYGIEATRRLAVAPGVPTSAWQQADMLRARGVEADVVEIETVFQIHSLVGSGRRPIILGILMARVPAIVRDHAFTGWHAMAILDGATAGSTIGTHADDPNFSPASGYRPDPDHGRKFYSDAVLRYAVIDNAPRWAVVPRVVKAIPSTTGLVIVEAGAKLRTTPRIGHSNYVRMTQEDHRAIRLGAVTGGQYRYWNGTRWATGNRWVLVRMPNGDRVYAIRPKVHALPLGAIADVNRAAQAEADDVLAGARRVPQSEAEHYVNEPISLETDRAIDPASWPAGPVIEEDPAP